MAFWNLLGFFHCLSNFEARCQRYVGVCDCWLFEQSLVCHFLENSTPALFSTLKVFLILHISDKRWIPALVLHCGSEAAPFPRTARLN